MVRLPDEDDGILTWKVYVCRNSAALVYEYGKISKRSVIKACKMYGQEIKERNI